MSWQVQKNAMETSTATPSIENKHRTTYSHKRSASRGLEQVLEREVLRRERPADPEARVDEASPRLGQRVGISRHIQQFERGRRRGRRRAEPRHHITERRRVAVARRRSGATNSAMDVRREPVCNSTSESGKCHHVDDVEVLGTVKCE